MAAHTPGPWKATGNGIHRGTTCVATTHMDPHEQRAVDARLIAAAPDMLAALKLLVEDVRGYAAWDRPCHALDVAEAALSKAEGR